LSFGDECAAVEVVVNSVENGGFEKKGDAAKWDRGTGQMGRQTRTARDWLVYPGKLIIDRGDTIRKVIFTN
jgi:hypothetical protein